jgi:subtilisin family serine protease
MRHVTLGLLSTLTAASLLLTAAPSHAASDVASWNLDRLDQTGSRLDGSFTPPSRGEGVRVYVVDTAIDTSHSEFEGRVAPGVDVTGTPADPNNVNCWKHGTHVAGIAVGKRYGIASAATLVPVRAIDCTLYSDTLLIGKALEWILADHAKVGGPAVVNMSLGVKGLSPNVHAQITELVNSGLVVVAGAGNTGENACKFTPGAAPDAFTVGASDDSDTAPRWSNSGSCVSAWAPGVDITSAKFGGGFRVGSGTSQAAPHASGVAAVLRAANPTLSSAREVLALMRSLLRPRAITQPDGTSGPLLGLPVVGAPATVAKLRAAKLSPQRAVLKWKASGTVDVTVKGRLRNKSGSRHLFSLNRSKLKLKLVPGTKYRVKASVEGSSARPTKIKFRAAQRTELA